MAELSKEERQFSLILTLISHRYGLLIDEILGSVPGYRDKYNPNNKTSLDSLKRQFERDKSDIRDLGIVIETLTLEYAWEDGHETRYRISESDYELPEDVTFSPAEFSLLRLAAEAWRDGSLSMESRHALTKLRSLGIPANDALVGVAPRINTSNDTFDVLEETLQRQGVARFLYLKPGEGAPTERTVAPLALTNRHGIWHMLGHDIDVHDQRTFLLSRMVSTPTKLPNRTFDGGAIDYSDQLENELSALELQNTAVLRVDPSSDAHIRLCAIYGPLNQASELELHFSDVNILADELTEFGDSVRALSPASLVEALQSRFGAIAHNHGGVK